MKKTKSLKEEIDKYFAEYISVEKQMYNSKDLDELKILANMLSELYEKLFKLLVKLREEQNQSFKLISKDITLKISKKNRSIHENFERLDPYYDYEQGVLEENED